MNAPPATPSEGGTLTKTADWAIHMVIAAMKCASDEKTALTYTTPDEAKYGILKTLNWLEAHDEYEWPDFSQLNLDFTQVMRLRRALVQDVFNALHKAGTVRVGAPGTPESDVSTRRGRPTAGEGRLMTGRKRICRREDDAGDDAMSEHSGEQREDEAFIIQVMMDLACRSKVNVEGYMQEKRDSRELANMLHDNLVEVWDGPQQEFSDQHEKLRQKADVWERRHPLKSSPREQTAQASPATAQKPTTELKPTPTKAGSWDLTAANKEWANTHTCG